MKKFCSVASRRFTTALACLLFAPAALANSSASADIAAPLRASNSPAQSISAQDEQFSKLFNSWQALEENKAPALAAVTEAGQAAAAKPGLGSTGFRASRGEVSIPSRNPLAGMRLTSDYGMRVHPVVGGMRAHKGIDLAAPVGTPIYATADGTVSRASWFSSYGLYISLEHGANLQTRYAHLSKLNVAEGQRVQKGDIIGFVGSTGRSTGPHLHYEVRVDGQAVNPIPYMNGGQLAKAAEDENLGRGGPEW